MAKKIQCLCVLILLVFPFWSLNTAQGDIENLSKDFSLHLNRLVTHQSAFFILMREFDLELNQATDSFNLADLKSQQKILELRELIENDEETLTYIYSKAWERALRDLQGASKSEVESLHNMLRNHLDMNNTLALFNVADRFKNSLEGVERSMRGQSQLSRQGTWLLEQIVDFETQVQDMEADQYQKMISDFINHVGALDEETRDLISNPRSNVMVPGFKNIDGYNMASNHWVLTFDDGPHKTRTQNIQKILATNNVKGEFFWLSKLVKVYSKIALQTYKLGHHINSHSVDHANLTKLGGKDVTLEVSGSRKVIESVLHASGASGYRMKYFRCPYGACWSPKSKTVQQAIKDAGLTHVFWNVESLDTGDKNTKSVLSRVLKQMKVQKRGVILFHDIHSVAENVLPLLFKSEYVNSTKIKWQTL